MDGSWGVVGWCLGQREKEKKRTKKKKPKRGVAQKGFCLCLKSETKGRVEVFGRVLLLVSRVGDNRQNQGDEG